MALNMTLKAVLKLVTDQFTKGLTTAQKQLAQFGGAIKTAFSVGSVVMLGKSMLDTTKTFEDSMARVQAVSNATRGEYKMMEKEALRLGATTRYTSTQVANTLEVLTRNGLKAKDATNVLSETLHLAQANAVGLADAGNMLTNSLNMFGLKTEEVSRVADVMSSVVSNTATNLQDFYDALVNAAPMANALGIGIEETSAAIGALAQVGVKGADAGTQLRMALQKLVDPSAMKKLDKLGIKINEETIRMKGFQGVLEELAKADLPVSQLNEIFTVRSSKAVLQLVNSFEQFNRVLEITKNSAGTTERMFREGVGSIRYEVDILKSVWENFLITVGNTGPIHGFMIAMLRGAQNVINSFKTIGGGIAAVATVIALASRKTIAAHTAEAMTAKKTQAIKTRLLAIEIAQNRQKAYEKKLATETLTKQEEKETRAVIANAKARIKAKRAEIVEIKASKAALAGWLGIASVVATVGLELLVTKLIEMTRQMREANQAITDAKKNATKLNSQVNILKNMIGDGSNKDSLVGAVNEAKAMFPEFADAIEQAYLAAGKTQNYENLKNILQEIADLQNAIAVKDALKLSFEAKGDRFTREMQNPNNQSLYAQFSKDLKHFLSQNKGLDKEGITQVFKHMKDILVLNDGDTDKQVNDLKSYLDGLGFKKTNAEVRKYVTDLKAGKRVFNRSSSMYEFTDNGYQSSVQAYKDYTKSVTNVSREDSQLKFNTAYDKFLKASDNAAKTLTKGTRDYNDKMSELVDQLFEETKGLSLHGDQQEELNRLRKQYPSKNKPTPSYTPGGGSESKKKTEFDRLTDALDDYVKDSKQLDEQLKNGAINQLQFDAAMVKLNHDTWLAVAGISELDKKIAKLNQTQKDALKKVQDNASDSDTEAAKVGITEAIKKYSESLSEINEKRKNGQYSNDDEYMEALVKLENETWEAVSAFKNLDTAVGLLPESIRKQYTSLQDAAQANKDFAKKMQDFDLDKYFVAPVFTGATKEERQYKGEEFNQLREILTEYMKRRAEIQQKADKGVISTDETEKQFEDLDNRVIITVAAFRYLNEVVGRMPKAYQDALDKIKKSDTNNLIGNDSGYDYSKVQKYTDEFKKAMDPKNWEMNKYLENIEIEVDLKLANVEELEKMFQDLSDKILSGDIDTESIGKALSVLKLLVEALKLARDEAEKTKDKMTYSEQMVEMEKEVKAFRESAVENISSVASAFDRLIDAIESIAEAFGAEWELEGLKKVMTVVNGVIQVMEALKSMVVMVQTVQSIAAKKQQIEAHKQALANIEVAASETIKAKAAAGSAAAGAADSVAGVPLVGPALAVAAVAAVVAAILAGMSRFENGGILQGSSSHGDKNIYRGNKGEMVINKAQQGSLYRAISEGRLGGGQVEFVIRGDQLIGAINNHNRKWN